MIHAFLSTFLSPIATVRRKLGDFWLRTFVTRTYSCVLTPGEDVQKDHRGYFATALDPQFGVYPKGGQLSPGWCLMSYTAHTGITDSVFVPKIYSLDTLNETPPPVLLPGNFGRHQNDSIGQVFIQPDVVTAPEPHATRLHAHFSGKIQHLFRYRFGPDGFRFDPFDLDYPRTRIPNRGWFDITAFQITCLGLFPLIVFCLRHGLLSTARFHRKRLRKIGLSLLRRRGVRRFLNWAVHRTYREIQPYLSATQWFRFLRANDPSSKEIVFDPDSERRPLFSVMLYCDSKTSDKLERCLWSVYEQTYPNWETLILADTATEHRLKNKIRRKFRDDRIRWLSATEPNLWAAVQGDYACLVSSLSQLEPHALKRYAVAASQHDPDIIYSDEAILGGKPQRVIGLNLRPAFSYDYFLSNAFLGLFTAIRTTQLRLGQTKFLDLSCDAFNESLILEALSRTETILHIPDILHCRHRTAGAHSDQRLDPRSVENHLKTIGFNAATVSRTSTPGIYLIRFYAPDSKKTAIVIPTKNQGTLLRQAIESIYQTVPDELFHLVVIDHESDEPDTLAYLETLKANHTVLRYQGIFHFSKINNFAVSHLGDHYPNILFLNNDIEAIRTGWFESMADKLKRKDVGIVGAVLLYPRGEHEPNQSRDADGTVGPDSLFKHHRIQHAGVILGIGNAEHFMKDEIYQDPYNTCHPKIGFLPPVTSRGFSAVTAACLMIRTDVFHMLGGFEEKLVVGFGDVDLCLRASNIGYKILCDGEAVLIHHESASRSRGKDKDPHPGDSVEFRHRYISDIDHGDPFHNPLLASSTWRHRTQRSPVRNPKPVYRIVTNPGIHTS